MSTRRIGNSWWVDFSFDRRRYRCRCPDNSRAGAQAYELLLRRRLAQGEDIHRRDPDISLTFGEAAEQWLSTYVATNARPSVHREYRAVLINHLLPRFGERALSSLSAVDVERFKAEQMKLALSPKTINNHLVVLSGLLHQSREFGWIESAPRITWLKVPPQPFDFLSPEESSLLLDANRDSRWHDMMLCALRTGMRVGELLALRWQAVSSENRVITVSRSIVRGIEGAPKNNRIRHIPIAADLRDTLRARERRQPHLFGQGDGRPSTLPMATRGLLTACKRAGLRRIGWHVLRHSFASQLAAAGAPIPAIQSLLGHSTIQMTMRYAHLSPSTLASVVELLPTAGSSRITPDASHPSAQEEEPTAFVLRKSRPAA